MRVNVALFVWCFEKFYQAPGVIPGCFVNLPSIDGYNFSDRSLISTDQEAIIYARN